MAKIELYVVTTENPDKVKLSALKLEIIKKYGGLTVIPNCTGFWVDSDTLYQDAVEIWQILSSSVISTPEIMAFGERLKILCKQKSQLVTVNDTPFYI